MMTIIPRELRVIPGGCQYRTRDGKIRILICDQCVTEGRTCELEPCARRLAEVTRNSEPPARLKQPQLNG
jgi:hypothetical protein